MDIIADLYNTILHKLVKTALVVPQEHSTSSQGDRLPVVNAIALTSVC
ncbi:MAG: hypothetical protein AB4352_25150 [Hormoscilla sp.]